MVSSKSAKAMIKAKAKMSKQRGMKNSGRKQIYGLPKVQNGNSKRFWI